MAFLLKSIADDFVIIKQLNINRDFYSGKMAHLFNPSLNPAK